MKRYLLLFLSSAVFSFSCDTLSNISGIPGGYTENEAAEGIRQALSQGTGIAIQNLNRQDGFFGNQAYKLFLPPDASKIEYTLRDLGLGSVVDRAILQINRAAETAVGEAKPIFVDAVRQMTIADAINIVKGARDAATQYFRDKTTDKLISAFSPIIKQALDRTNATRYYGDAIAAYNKLPTTFNKLNPDLPSYVTQKAVSALFDQIAQEEANIRANPAARTTDILKKVFGKK
jgi:hypothetical protein